MSHDYGNARYYDYEIMNVFNKKCYLGAFETENSSVSGASVPSSVHSRASTENARQLMSPCPNIEAQAKKV